MRSLVAIFFSLITFYSSAQLPEEALQKISNQFPVQKLYLHTDREMYFAGETVWFKAYLLTDYAPDSISTTLYLDLLNDSSRNIIHKIIPLAFGYGLGSFALPDSLLKGNYFIRAYTATMLNSPVNILYTKKILVYSVNQLKQKKTDKEQASLLMNFFPESGNLVTDMMNTVAFKATNKDGSPVTVEGFVLNNREDTVARISTVHDGMGKFEITPLDGEQYTAVLSGDFQGQKFKLPTATRDGISMKVNNRIGGKAFEINQKNDNPFFRVAYILG
ncbi:MAG: hypothetical protein JSU05_09235, partial [Bacteroidetes bacterium]|nr:hypothetical protein [Bacteroidota bacterium]